MKIGVRAHDYGKHSIEGLASLLREEGYDGAQLALPKVFEEIDSYEDIRLSHIERIRRAFEKNRVEIPVMGCYMDLGNPDRSVRESAVETLKTCLFYAKEMGAGVVGTETAYPRLSREERAAWCPYMMDSLMRVMEEAQRIDMKLAIEPVYWHPLADLETTLKTIRMVDELSREQAGLDSDRLLKAIKYRRSVRRFKQKPVSSGDLDMLVQAGRYTATAKNMQDCRFIFVQKELEILKTLIWDGIGRILDSPAPGPAQAYQGFYEAHMADSKQDYLFRNAPAVLFIASEANIDAGLAAQNMELMGVSLGLGFLYNGYLRWAAEMNPEVLDWLGVGEKKIEACALLGYPDITYKRTAPRRAADVIFR